MSSLQALFIILLCNLSSYTLAKAQENTKNEHLLKLIKKEEKLITSMRRKGPKLLWRLLEIRTERLKIHKRQENERFIKDSISKPNIVKSHYFRKTSRDEKKIYNDGLAIIKRWPDFYHVSDIYYTLALNNRDYGDNKKQEYLLNHSLRTSQSKGLTYKIRVALAEYYYNNKIYKKASRHYFHIIKDTQNKWLTKHLYNYSWCLIKIGQYKKAITLAKHALELGKEDQYVAVSQQIYNNMGLFYILSRNIEEGVAFYLKNVTHPTAYLIKMAQKSASDVSYEKAKYVLTQALHHARKQRYNEKVAQVYFEQMKLYRNYKRDSLYLKTAKAIKKHHVKHPINQEIKDQVIDHLTSYTNYLQVHLRNDIERKKQSKINHQVIMSYMNILIVLAPQKRDFYHYYQAETLLSVNLVPQALNFYQKSLNAYKVLSSSSPQKLPHQKAHYKSQANKTFDSIFYALESQTLTKKKRDQFLEYSYLEHITLFPHTKRTQHIYPKLFHFYFKKKKVKQAKRVLQKFITRVPSDIKKQRELNTILIDYYISTHHIPELMQEVVKIEKGYLGYDDKYIKDALHILSNKVFDSYENMLKNGQKEKALLGYESLYSNLKTPHTIRGQASFQLGLINTRQNKMELALTWFQRSYPLMSREQISLVSSHISNLAHELFLSQRFKDTHTILKSYQTKMCHRNYHNKNELYDLWITSNLMLNKAKISQAVFRLAKKCSSDVTLHKSLYRKITQYLYKYRTPRSYLHYTTHQHPTWEQYQDKRIESLYWKHFALKHKKNTNLLLDYIKENSRLAHKLSHLISFDLSYKFITKVKIKPLIYYNGQKKFNENNYNRDLEYNMNILSQVRSTVQKIFKIKHAQKSVQSSHVLVTLLDSLSYELKQITPRGHGKEYRRGFKQAMRHIALDLIKEKNSLQSSIDRILLRNPMMIRDYSVPGKLAYHNRDEHLLAYRHPAALFTLPIDHQGGSP